VLVLESGERSTILEIRSHMKLRFWIKCNDCGEEFLHPLNSVIYCPKCKSHNFHIVHERPPEGEDPPPLTTPQKSARVDRGDQMKKTNWIITHDGRSKPFGHECLRCGTYHKLPNKMSVKEFLRVARAFIALHKLCATK